MHKRILAALSSLDDTDTFPAQRAKQEAPPACTPGPMAYNQAVMSESNRHSILRAALKAILAASDLQWWIKGPATFIAELKSKNLDLPKSHANAIEVATEEELIEAVQEQIGQFQQSQAGLERIEAMLAMLRADMNQSSAELLDQFNQMLAISLKKLVAAQDYSSDNSSSGETEPRQVFNVPFARHACFKGRDELLTELHSLLIEGKHSQTRQVLRGLGGIGKTQVAVEYAYRFRSTYETVLWIRAQTEIELNQSFADSARSLRLEFDASDHRNAVRAVKVWLDSNDNWLLIFDNADTPDQLKEFLPRNLSGHVLVTSRANVFDLLGVLKPIELPPLSAKSAADFLLERTARPHYSLRESAAATKLAEELGFLPLALEQAGAYIHSIGLGFETYLDIYSKRRDRLDFLERGKPRIGDYPKSVLTTWTVNFDEIESSAPASADLLRISSCLSSADIPFRLVELGASATSTQLASIASNQEYPELVIGELLQPLLRFSLVRNSSLTESYSLHRLVQSVLVSTLDPATARNWIRQAVCMLRAGFPKNDFKNWGFMNQLMPHVIHVCTIAQTFNVETPELIELANESGNYLEEQAFFDEAEQILEQIADILANRLGTRHAHFATVLGTLGKVYFKNQKFEQGMVCVRQSLEIKRTTLDEFDPSIAISLNDCAVVLMHARRFADAERFFRQANAITLASQGDQHPDYAVGLGNIAEVFRRTGRFAEAEKNLREARRIMRNRFGRKSPDYAVMTNNLACLYLTVRRFKRAEWLYKLTLSIFRISLRDNHPHIRQCQTDLHSCQQAKLRTPGP